MNYQEISNDELENRLVFLEKETKRKHSELIKSLEILENDVRELIALRTEIQKRTEK